MRVANSTLNRAGALAVLLPPLVFLSVRARPLPPRPLPRLPRLMVLSVPCRMRRRRPLCVSARLSCLASAALLLLSLCFLAVCSTSAAPELTPTACPTQVVQVTGLVSARIIEPSQASESFSPP
jgi:hypothetical protein